MAVPLKLQDAADLIDRSIQRIDLKGSEKNVLYNQYFNVVDGVTDYYEKDSSLSGLGYASRIVENAAVVAESPVQGFDQTYTQVEFGNFLTVTKQMWKFGIRKRKLEGLVQEVVQSVEDKRELLCADRLDQSFNTSYTVEDAAGNYVATISGGDGVAFVSNAHTREDGGANWNNRVTDGSSNNLVFDYDGLKAAERTAALQVGPKGKPLNVNLDTLVVSRGHAPHHRAREILGAIRRNEIPGSADNDGAGVAAFKVIALPWVTTNTGYWWMFDSRMKNDRFGLQYKESQPLMLEDQHIVYRTGEIQYKASIMFDIGFNDARGWVGSQGTT